MNKEVHNKRMMSTTLYGTFNNRAPANGLTIKSNDDLRRLVS